MHLDNNLYWLDFSIMADVDNDFNDEKFFSIAYKYQRLGFMTDLKFQHKC